VDGSSRVKGAIKNPTFKKNIFLMRHNLKLILSIILVLFFSSLTAQSVQDLQKQLDDMSKQLSQLKTELQAIRSMVQVQGGNLSINTGMNRQDAVGAQYALNVGSDYTISTGRNHNFTTGSSSTISIGVNFSETIGGNRAMSIAKDFNTTVGKNFVFTAKDAQFEGLDQIVLKSGNAMIILRKNGDIELKGNMITAKATGDVLLKGAKVQQGN
jgi:type VI secretion system secreted protein VgrG